MDELNYGFVLKLLEFYKNEMMDSPGGFVSREVEMLYLCSLSCSIFSLSLI